MPERGRLKTPAATAEATVLAAGPRAAPSAAGAPPPPVTSVHDGDVPPAHHARLYRHHRPGTSWPVIDEGHLLAPRP
ncbi:hypothetical protein D0Q02_06150 [Micromonospora craniellae]|uniref:Uncharacterized protein n=1 Tax=Micromonospora craniellae TaxID=2294034 RepID=A0A372G3H6_9ACTN|nr:hypothetical protein D0Q02_06150 [Micromonospora craniellae]